jgi:hypothetical protein
MKIPKMFKPRPANQNTLQSLQQEFNQELFSLGDLHYRKHMINQELRKIDALINTCHQKADQIGKDARKAQAKMQGEVMAKVEEGKADQKETPNEKASDSNRGN